MKIIQILTKALARKRINSKELSREEVWDDICAKDPRNPGCKVYDL
jgi:hypothetical protein